MTFYATLDETKNELKATTTADDDKLFEKIRIVSRRVDAQFKARRPFFAPYIESREWWVQPMRVDPWLRTFRYDNPLLAQPTAVVIGSTTMTVGTNIEAWPTVHPPFNKLRLMNSCDSWYRFCNSDDPVMVTITGQWGWHDDFSNAWLKVDDLQAGINATVTSITVDDIDGSDDLGRSPRISAGNLLRINTEFMEVTATDTATDIATVRRGVNGSTAAAHLADDDVEVWETHETIRRATARQAAFLYARRGAYESTNITDVGVLNFPADLLAEFRNIMQELAYQ
jgi:hypothetical protein